MKSTPERCCALWKGWLGITLNRIRELKKNFSTFQPLLHFLPSFIF
jgi:hypothetical protein